MCLSRTRHGFGLFVCVVETLILSGSIYGFVSVIPMFQEDGVYYDLCKNLNHSDDVGDDEIRLSVLYHYDCTALWTIHSQVYQWVRCESEERTYTLIFTVAMFLSMFIMPIFGSIYDRFGTWIVRIIAM